MTGTSEGQKEKVLELKHDVLAGDAVEIGPVNRVSRHGNVYRYSYGHDGVVLGEVEDSFQKHGREYISEDGIVVTKYDGEEPLALTEDGVFCRQEAPKDGLEQLEQQAYYALSLLAEDGLVRRWRKR